MILRRVLLKFHSLLGISAGFVLAVVGLTGAALAFDEEIMAALSPDVVVLAPGRGSARPPDELIAAASRQRGGLAVSLLVLHEDSRRAARVFFVAPIDDPIRGEPSYLDPVSARLLGPATGEHFFLLIEGVHRWLALPGGERGPGRVITGGAALALVYFALSGLWLRWPRRPLDPREWLRIDFRRNGLAFYRTLHAVTGTWVLLLYLFSASTGLWWAFDWYRDSVSRVLQVRSPMPPRPVAMAPGAGPAPSVDRAWKSFLGAGTGHFETAILLVPHPGEPVRIRAYRPGAISDAATDDLLLDPLSGAILQQRLYHDMSAGEILAANSVYVHRGSVFGPAGRLALFCSALALPLYPVTGLLLYLGRRRREHRAHAALTVRR